MIALHYISFFLSHENIYIHLANNTILTNIPGTNKYVLFKFINCPKIYLHKSHFAFHLHIHQNIFQCENSMAKLGHLNAKEITYFEYVIELLLYPKLTYFVYFPFPLYVWKLYYIDVNTDGL